MSVAKAIEDLQGRVGKAFTAVEEKGGTLPEGKTTHTLPAAIRSITPKPNVDRISLYGNTSIKTVDFTKPIVCDLATMKNLGYCFYGCTSLSSLTLPEGFGSKPRSVAGCFQNCRSLRSISFGKGFASAATRIETGRTK